MNTLKAEKRDMAFKAKKVRREGYVVGNLFGKKIKDSIPVKMVKKDVDKLLKTDHKGSQIMLDVEGKKYDVLIKNVDFNPLKGRIDSIEFQALVSDEKVQSVAEVIIENHDAIAEGILRIELSEISYTALPAALVDHVQIDVGSMKIGDAIHVKDLPIASNPDITIKNDPEAIVVTVTAIHNAAVPEPEAEGEAAEGEGEAAEEEKKDE